MASTFTTNLALEKQANGENSNTWGTLLNTVLDQIEDAIATRLSLSVAGSANVTLTAAQALNMYQEYTGALTGNINVIVPSLDKVYFVFNNTSGAYTLTVKTSAGTGIAVTQGKRAILYCDSTNVVKMIAVDDAAADFLTTQGDLLYRGTSTVQRLAVGGANSVLTANGTTVSWGTTITLGGGLTVNGTITAASLLDVTQSVKLADYVSIASGGTVNIGTALSNRISITGTTLITRLGTSSVGNFRELKFTAATPLGHDGTALILPGTATMTAANNDVADFISLGAGNWHCARYQKASGAAVAGTSYAIDQQNFTGSGTWTKPATGTYVLIEAWGGGGAAGKASGSRGSGGGGGGAYVFRLMLLSGISDNQTVTIGAGGVATTAQGDGAAGGNTTFGALVTAYGGGGGDGTANASGGGGGGGGAISAGSVGAGLAGGNGGNPTGGAGGAQAVAGTGNDGFGGGGGGGARSTGNGFPGGASGFGGGGGGGGCEGQTSGNGGASVYGGGGGSGGVVGAGTPGAAGTSLFGGAGGAGAAGSGAAGTQPGGGGGGTDTGDGAAGGDGQCRVIVW